MPEQIVKSGSDTWVVSTYPNANRATSAYPIMQSTQRRILLHLPLSLPAGAVILSATLSGYVRGTWAAQNVTVRAISSAWSVTKATWNNQPSAPTGTQITTAVPASTDGAAVNLDATSLVQAIANGSTNYGFQITTDSAVTNQWYGFDSGKPSWQLTVEYADDPTAPTQLNPAGVISLAKWQARIDDQDDLSQMQVQIDPAANPATAWSSGWVTVASPVLNLVSTSYPGLTDGSSTYWRAQVKTVDGQISDWSDWVQVTRHVKPALVLDNPAAGGTVKSMVPVIQAHLSPAGSATSRWQVQVRSADGTKLLWDSGDLMGATLNAQVPRTYKGKTVLAEDLNYRLRVIAWDRSDRVASYGDPASVISDTTFTVDHDSSQAVPTLSSVTQADVEGPRLRLHWTRTATPDEFEIWRDGGIIASVESADALVSALTWEWVDDTAEPNTLHTYKVRAVTNGDHSAYSAQQQITPNVTGVWLITSTDAVLAYDTGVDSIKQTDKRTTYTLPYADEDVDIIGAVSGYSGSMTLEIDNRGEQDVDDARALLETMRQHPHQPVQLAWATVSIPVYLRGLSVVPSPDMFPDRDRAHVITFDFYQTDDQVA